MKDRLSKPEKRECKGKLYIGGINTDKHYNQGLEDMEAYHDQEMQRVVDETWKKAREQYKFDLTVTDERNKHLEAKVKQLEQQIKELKSGAWAKWASATIDELQNQIKESREVSVEEIANIIAGYEIINEGAIAEAIYNLINGDKE